MTYRFAALLIPAASLEAQQDSLVSLRGRVRADSAPVPAVAIQLPDLGRQVLSDEGGRFSVDRVPRGRWRLEVRRSGFMPLDTTVEVGASERPIELALHVAAQQLVGVTVSAQGESGPRSAQLAEFEARRMRGIGRYVTAAELRAADNRTVPDVLRARMTGLALEWNALGVHAYNPNQQPPGALNRASANAGGKCYVQIVVDGVAIYQEDNGMSAATPPPDLSEYLTRDLDGIEYYSSPARTPPEFRTNGALCGTLVLWSRRR